MYDPILVAMEAMSWRRSQRRACAGLGDGNRRSKASRAAADHGNVKGRGINVHTPDI